MELSIGHRYGCGTINDVKSGELVETFTKFLAPSIMFEYLVDDKHSTAAFDEFIGKTNNPAALEVETIQVNVETPFHINVKVEFGVLQQECSLANSTWTQNPNQSITPINLVHQGTSHCCICMLN